MSRLLYIMVGHGDDSRKKEISSEKRHVKMATANDSQRDDDSGIDIFFSID